MKTQENVVKKQQTIFAIFVSNLYLMQEGVAHKPWVTFIQLLSKGFQQDFHKGGGGGGAYNESRKSNLKQS